MYKSNSPHFLILGKLRNIAIRKTSEEDPVAALSTVRYRNINSNVCTKVTQICLINYFLFSTLFIMEFKYCCFIGMNFKNCSTVNKTEFSRKNQSEYD